MSKIYKATFIIPLIINILVAILLILSAYSPYFEPSHYPILSNFGLGFPIVLTITISFLIFWIIFKKRFTLLSLFSILFVSPQILTYAPLNIQKDPPADVIKILSYNVMSFNMLEKDERGKNEILEYLKNSNADILCLQEYSSSKNNKFVTEKDINNALKNYPFREITRIGSKGSSNQLAIFAKFPILRTDRIIYESSYNGSVAHKIKVKDEEILVINNHLESNKITREDKAVYQRILKLEQKDQLIADSKGLASKIIEAAIIREKQAQKVDNIVNISKLPTKIICGDFNDSPLSYTNHLLEGSLDNAFVQSGRGLGISYNQNKFYFRIDNILISKNLKSYKCTVDNSIKASDHYPIWCYLSKK